MNDEERLKIYEEALQLIAGDLSDAAPEALQTSLRRNIARAALVGHLVFKDDEGRTVKYRILEGPLRGDREALYWPTSSKKNWKRRNEIMKATRDVRTMRTKSKQGGPLEE